MGTVTTEQLDAWERLANDATEGPWRAGRRDMVSYHGDGVGPYKNVYADDPDGEMHMGDRLPATVCEAFDAVGVDCRDNASFIAASRLAVPLLIQRIRELEKELANATH